MYIWTIFIIYVPAPDAAALLIIQPGSYFQVCCWSEKDANLAFGEFSLLKSCEKGKTHIFRRSLFQVWGIKASNRISHFIGSLFVAKLPAQKKTLIWILSTDKTEVKFIQITKFSRFCKNIFRHHRPIFCYNLDVRGYKYIYKVDFGHLQVQGQASGGTIFFLLQKLNMTDLMNHRRIKGK